jgi:sortase A
MTLGFFGVTLILLSVGWVFADVRIVSRESFAIPKKEAMKLTIPRMKRVNNVPVYTGTARDAAALRNGTLHLKNTGWPWEEEANVYIAGHRLGYPNTESFLVFWDLNKLETGDKVLLKDAEDQRYVYRVFKKFVVAPNESSVVETVAGKNIVSLQTCTLPDYSKRLIVQAALVRIDEDRVQSKAT